MSIIISFTEKLRKEKTLKDQLTPHLCLEEFSLKFESWGAEYSTLKDQFTSHLCLEEFSLKFESWGAEYSTLKGQLTPHQHAILIDLGRTFPSHGKGRRQMKKNFLIYLYLGGGGRGSK